MDVIRRWVVPRLAVGMLRKSTVISFLCVVWQGSTVGVGAGGQKAAAGACLSLSNPMHSLHREIRVSRPGQSGCPSSYTGKQ